MAPPMLKRKQTTSDMQEEPANPLMESIAGVAGQLISSTVTYPLDVLRVRVQTEKLFRMQQGESHSGPADGPNVNNMAGIVQLIWREGGWLGFFRGVTGEWTKETIKNFIFFYVRTALVGAVMRRNQGSLSIYAETGLGMIAGITTMTILTPLSVAHVRMQAGTSHAGFIQTIMDIYNEGGLDALYKGLGPSFMLSIYPALNFMIAYRTKGIWQRAKWRKMRDKRMKDMENPNSPNGSGGAELPPLPSHYNEIEMSGFESFLIGALSQLIATTVTYPVHTARVLMQAGVADEATGKKRNMIQLLVYLVREEGLIGSFKGIDSMLLHSVAAGAFQWLGMEKVQILLKMIFRY